MAEDVQRKDDGAWIKDIVLEFANSPENNLGPGRDERAFDDPLVGFARGDDPIFDEFKRHIGEFFWTPAAIFEKTFPGSRTKPGELTVISWVLPQTKQTKLDSRREKVYPSERWARNRLFGEQFNAKLRNHVVKVLTGAGYPAVAPGISPFWEMKMSERYGFASTWSERHAAYAAGLGTFGLCDGIITPVGKAIRCGSVVARIAVAPTERPYKNHHEYCPFFADGTCGKCIERCPVGALSAAGHDKGKCRAYVDGAAQDYIRSHYQIDIYGCGLCQTKVPCESRIPARRKTPRT